MNTLGLRHVALNVQDPQRSKEFYIRVLRMKLEWEPDPENIYLTSGGLDNLALHKSNPSSNPQILDHIGFMVPEKKDVDDWFQWVKSQNVPILKEIKDHRDRTRSFYFKDPDQIVIQIIYHPLISKNVKREDPSQSSPLDNFEEN